MNIRGVSSANGDSAPLVLVDGIPGDINMINPQDIDAISVLKAGLDSITSEVTFEIAPERLLRFCVP